MDEGRKTSLILAMLLVCTFMPTFATVPFAQQDSVLVIREVFEQTSVAYLWLSPIIHVVFVVLLVGLYRYGSSVGRVADAFFGSLFLFFAFGNHIAVTENYGLVVLTGNVVRFSLWVCFGCGKSIDPVMSMFLRGFQLGDIGFCRLFSWLSGLR